MRKLGIRIFGRRWKGDKILVVCSFILLISSLFPIDNHVLSSLTPGWFRFATRELPLVRVQAEIITWLIVCVAILVAASHVFLKWVSSYLKQPHRDGATRAGWSLRTTLGVIALVVLVFVAGTAAVGISHQSVWLLRDRNSLYDPISPRKLRTECAVNLHTIGQCLRLYASMGDGKLPDSLARLLREADYAQEELFVCPESKATVPMGRSREEHAAQLHDRRYCSYSYHGQGLELPIEPRRAIAIEWPDNHYVRGSVGINMLFGDGDVRWLEGNAADDLLAKLGFVQESSE